MSKHILASRLRPGTTQWLWPDRIPYGAVTLLAANPGTGKSSLGSEIAARVTRGRKFPGCDTPVRRGKVLICCAEENKEGAPLYRANEQRADLRRLAFRDDVFYIEEEHEYFSRLARDGYTLFVFDPLNIYMRAQLGRPLREELTRVNQFFHNLGVAVIGVVHFVKTWGGNVRTSIEGGRQWYQVARAVTVLAKLNPQDSASPIIFANEKTSLTRSDIPVVGFKMETNPATKNPHLVWLDDAEIPPHVAVTGLLKEASKTGLVLPTKLGQIEEVIKERLDANGGWQYQSIITEELSARGFKERSIAEAKKRLKIESVKETGKGGKWKWVLPSTHSSAEEESARPTPGNGHDPDDTWVRDAEGTDGHGNVNGRAVA